MSAYLILPLTKGPHGRPGDDQDWFQGLVLAKRLLSLKRPSRILVISDVHVEGFEHEADIYASALRRLGVASSDLEIVKQAQETIDQIEIAKTLSRLRDAKLVVISTFFHYWRVEWLFRGFPKERWEHHRVWGKSRPREALTDIILTFAFPVLDILGLRRWFQSKITGRRKSGKHF